MSRRNDRPAAQDQARTSTQHAAATAARRASAVVQATGQLQEGMARRTAQLHREAAHQLRMATNPVELMNVQAAMLMAGWQHSVQCTTDLARTWFALGAAGALPGRTDPQAH